MDTSCLHQGIILIPDTAGSYIQLVIVMECHDDSSSWETTVFVNAKSFLRWIDASCLHQGIILIPDTAGSYIQLVIVTYCCKLIDNSTMCSPDFLLSTCVSQEVLMCTLLIPYTPYISQVFYFVEAGNS